MADQSSSKTVDLQDLVTRAARAEIVALNAGIEYWRTWFTQAAKFSNITNDTLQAIEDDKASASDTITQYTELARENAEVFGELYTRMSQNYLDEIEGLASVIRRRDPEASSSGSANSRSPSRRGAASKKKKKKKTAS